MYQCTRDEAQFNQKLRKAAAQEVLASEASLLAYISISISIIVSDVSQYQYQ